MVCCVLLIKAVLTYRIKGLSVSDQKLAFMVRLYLEVTYTLFISNL
jgi:hypothetical protein